jgi:type II secretory pathway pseudopilin PulG
MSTHAQRSGASAGFSLAELVVTMAIVLAIMGATLAALTNAYKSNESAKSITELNSNLRISTDLIVRDLIQVGQGLPMGRTVQVPNGAGALHIQRPTAPGSACTEWPDGTLVLPAVTAGPGCGPTVNGVATDIITTLAADSALEGVPVNAFDLGAHSATISTAAQAQGGRDISTGGPDDIREGDLLMFTKGSLSSLVYVTGVEGQVVSFESGDPMNLNQFDAGLNGTVDDLATTAPTTANSALVSRLRLITYYVDASQDQDRPRLVRHIGWGDPDASPADRGRTVAFSVENLQLSYDLVDGVTDPTNVKMTEDDLAGGSDDCDDPCSPNQIRKVNVFVSGRSARRFSATGEFFRNTLATQVSLRSLALVDRYR